MNAQATNKPVSKRKLPRETYPRPQGGALRPHGNPATFLKT
jgi:hypothetical protein